MGYYVHNKGAIKAYLKKFDLGDDMVASYLNQALISPLSRYQPNLQKIEHADPRWDLYYQKLFEKRENTWVMFVPDKALSEKVMRVSHWLKAACLDRASWLFETDARDRSHKLAAIKTLDQALYQADKSRDLLNTELRRPHEIWNGSAHELRGDITTEMVLNKGYRMVRINTFTALQAHGEALHNCLRPVHTRDQMYDVKLEHKDKWAYYALHNHDNGAHALLEVNLEEGMLTQCTGKQNRTLPAGEYFDTVIEFIKERDFSVTDLHHRTGILHQNWDYYNINNVLGAPLPEHVLGNLYIKGTGITNIDDLKTVEGEIHTDFGTFTTLEAARNAFQYHYKHQETGFQPIDEESDDSHLAYYDPSF